MQDFKWYILKTKTNCEARAKSSIENLVKKNKMEDYVKKVFIPERDTVSVVKGKKVTRAKKIYPGYIFIEMMFSNEAWHLIKSATNVIHFVGGAKEKPQEVPVEQLNIINKEVQDSVENPQTQISFLERENVQVISGPFKNFSGIVEEVNHEKGRVKVNVNIFGRPTPVEFDFSQIHKEG